MSFNLINGRPLLKIAVAFLSVLLIAVIGGGVFVWYQTRPVTSYHAEKLWFVVKRGQSTQDIADELQAAGLIRNSFLFRLTVEQNDLGKSLQAGSFQLSPNMTYQEIAQALTEGTNDLWITLPEGWRREQIAQYLAGEPELIAFDELDFLQLTEGLEGRLFPDTYLIARESTAETIVSLLTNTFETKVVQGLAEDIAAAEREFDQVLTLASIVEREARGEEEMRQVAGILENRLEIGMPLQTDATLQYIKGYDSSDDNWWSPPLSVDKELESPFNTYLYQGLPPQPIANPGITAIRASLNPSETNYLYYLHDTDGQIHYAQSLEVHNANVRQYLR